MNSPNGTAESAEQGLATRGTLLSVLQGEGGVPPVVSPAVPPVVSSSSSGEGASSKLYRIGCALQPSHFADGHTVTSSTYE